MSRRILGLVLAVVLLTAFGVSGSSANPHQSPERGVKAAIAAQERHNAGLLETAGVVGTAVGSTDRGVAAVLIFTERSGVTGLPGSLDGVPVVVRVTGALAALHHRPGHSGGPSGGGGTTEPSTTSVWPRPVPIGISTGNELECSAGTIGARVTSGGDVYALSNNHVYALENTADIGSDVLQPGRFDTGCINDPANFLGDLSDFVPMVFDGETPNTVDAAIASTTTALLGNATPSAGYGTPLSETALPALGAAVQKFGRTSQLTRGTITGINATVLVGYDSGTALFVDQVIVESGGKPFIKGGDSGSMLVSDPGRNPTALLFAGNSSGKLAIGNPIDVVLAAFGVTIDGA